MIKLLSFHMIHICILLLDISIHWANLVLLFGLLWDCLVPALEAIQKCFGIFVRVALVHPKSVEISRGSVYVQFPTMNMDLLPFYEAKVLFSEGRGRM